ncbi:MAG: ABC transporter ATP-binding protein [Clostridia bacterium]|nr:ABC transporter ATP-binding protein [Clostridia bacterium]
MEIKKDNLSYTFNTTLTHAVGRYFKGINRNDKEQARFDKQTQKIEKIVAKGHIPEWSVVPADIVNIQEAREHIVFVIDRIINHFNDSIRDDAFKAEEVSNEVFSFLEEQASGSVFKVTQRMAKNTAIKLMEEVGIAEPRRRYRQYPFEFSGGMRQRIVIAIALAANPDVLICDEPTTALDVTIQSQILELINNLKKERNLSVIFITHDLGVVANMADRIAVMYAGKIVEYGTALDVFYNPIHPYTWALLSSMPDLDTKEKLEAIPGTPPNMIYPPVGDAFAERNRYALKVDFVEQPPMFKISDTHFAATWLAHPDAPKVDPPRIVTERIARMKRLAEADNGNKG